jgi:hypothetical protein
VRGEEMLQEEMLQEERRCRHEARRRKQSRVS